MAVGGVGACEYVSVDCPPWALEVGCVKSKDEVLLRRRGGCNM